jgi:hypothetical protein
MLSVALEHATDDAESVAAAKTNGTRIHFLGGGRYPAPPKKRTPSNF